MFDLWPSSCAIVKAGVKSNSDETTDWEDRPHIAEREAMPAAEDKNKVWNVGTMMCLK